MNGGNSLAKCGTMGFAVGMRKPAAALFLVLAMVPAAQARDSLGVFEGWGAFRDADGPRCYAIAEPEQTSRGARGDWRPFAAIGNWPERGVRNQLHVRLSRALRGGAKVVLHVGERMFELKPGRTDAWAADRRADAAIVAAIRSSTGMEVVATAANGAAFRDIYALRGAATAMDAAALGCAR